MIKGSFSLNVIALNNLLIKIASFTVCDKANNLASILNIVTISYLFALQAISPLNNFIIYLYKLFLSIKLSINNILLTQINDYALFLPFFPSFYPLLLIFLPLPFIPSIFPP